MPPKPQTAPKKTAKAREPSPPQEEPEVPSDADASSESGSEQGAKPVRVSPKPPLAKPATAAAGGSAAPKHCLTVSPTAVAKTAESESYPSAIFKAAFASLSCPEFTGFVGREEKNAKFFAVTNSEIPCHAHLYRSDKTAAFKITIVAVRSAGFSKAPYKMSFDKTKASALSSTAKPLAEMDINSDGAAVLNMYLFDKEGAAFDRGPRRDDSRFTVEAADTFVLFVNPKDIARSGAGMMMAGAPQGMMMAGVQQGMMMAGAQQGMMMAGAQQGMMMGTPLLPPDIETIPAMSLVEISATTRNVDAAMKFRITSIRPVTKFSLLSFTPTLRMWPQSLEEARMKALSKRDLFPLLTRDYEDREVPFFLSGISNKAFVCDDLLAESQMLSVANWSTNVMDENTRIDIPIHIARAYTNAAKDEFAVTMLQIAINTGAISFVVFPCDYWARQGTLSHLRAVPIIDTTLLLNCIQFENKDAYTVRENEEGGFMEYEFSTKQSFEIDENTQGDIIVILREYVHNTLLSIEPPAEETDKKQLQPLTADLVLSDDTFPCSSAVEVMFCVREPAAGNMIPLLKAFFRADRVTGTRSVCSGRFKRARIGCV